MSSVYEPELETPSALLERIGRPEVGRWTGHPFVRGLVGQTEERGGEGVGRASGQRAGDVGQGVHVGACTCDA